MQKTQDELSNSKYEGESSLVTIVINGNKEILSVVINSNDTLDKDDIEMLQDMIMFAFNDASKKVDLDKEKKLGKYGQGLAGLM